jgi:hypothetical protein
MNSCGLIGGAIHEEGWMRGIWRSKELGIDPSRPPRNEISVSPKSENSVSTAELAIQADGRSDGPHWHLQPVESAARGMGGQNLYEEPIYRPCLSCICTSTKYKFFWKSQPRSLSFELAHRMYRERQQMPPARLNQTG